MKTNLGPRGQILIPKKVRDHRQLKPGDDFEVLLDEEDPDLILLHRIRRSANAGLVDHLLACPWKEPLERPARSKEAIHKYDP